MNSYLKYKIDCDKTIIINTFNDILLPSIKLFFKDILIPLKKDDSEEPIISILIKIGTENGNKTVAPLQRIKIGDLRIFIECIEDYWSTKENDWYYSTEVKSVTFLYKNVTEDKKRRIIGVKKENLLKTQNKTHQIGNTFIPMNMDLFLWGNILINDLSNEVIIHKKKSNLTIKVKMEDFHQNVEVFNRYDSSILKFKDTILDKRNGDLFYFKREFFDKKDKLQKIFVYKDEKILFKTVMLNLSKIKPILTDSHIKKNFISMDIETQKIDGKLYPICISLFDGKISKSFFITDYKNYSELIRNAFMFLYRKKYDNHKIYFHNLSGFDFVFFLRELSLICKSVRPISRDNRLIEIKIKLGENKTINLSFRDSLLMLPSSLDKLAKTFIKDGKKEIFPFDFINLKKDLHYSGVIPDKKYFPSNITDSEYCEYKNSIKDSWNLKNETIKYCESDTIILYKIIEEFQKKIFNEFNIDPIKYPTLPAIGFAVFRSNFLREDIIIPKTGGELYNFIKRGYTGGAADLYHHKNLPNEFVYRYDVNSLFPFIMKDFKMPVGNPCFFEGDILKDNIYKNINYINLNLEDKKPFGFFEVEVEAPKDLNIPILQTKMKIKGKGYRTLSPLGKWKGVYFSEEIFNAMGWGYKFKVIKGYLFNKEYIFTEYVDYLYNLKVNSLKDSPDYIISKLLLNSLYGRFGMSPLLSNSEIVSKKQFEILDNNDNIVIEDLEDLENGYYLVTYYFEKEDDDDIVNLRNINVAIAAAVTAYSRIYMSFFKHPEWKHKIFYSDTDSLDINMPLKDFWVGKELGKFKLEHVWKKVRYVGNKAYIGVSSEGVETSKIRGIKNRKITFDEISKLLKRGAKLDILQERWIKNKNKGFIEIIDTTYELSNNDNKRISIYDDNDELNYTKPHTINYDEIIK